MILERLTSSRSKYSLTSSTNCSERSSPWGRLSSGPSVCGSVSSETDDAARESSRPMSWRSVSEIGGTTNGSANPFYFSECVYLTRRSARGPYWIDILAQFMHRSFFWLRHQAREFADQRRNIIISSPSCRANNTAKQQSKYRCNYRCRCQ